MKKLWYILLASYLLLSCEDVIDVDVPIDDPRLTIDALFRIDSSQAEQTVQIRAGITNGFFSDLSVADLEEISLVNIDYEPTGPDDSRILQLNQVAPGVYEATRATTYFTEGVLRLFVKHQGQRYIASTSYVPTSNIEELVQGDESLFGGDAVEVVISFQDTPNRNDFYLFDFDFDEFLVSEDLFYPGQLFEFSYFYDEDLLANTTVAVSIIGVDNQFYNYMNQLIAQADGGNAGPFQTPAATVRGNIINATAADVSTIDQVADLDDIDTLEGIDTDNFALGYFAISQTFTKSITIE